MAHLPSGVDYHGLSAIQQYCFENAEEKGFHEEGTQLRYPFTDQPGGNSYDEGDVRALRNYYANRLMLIAGEVTEAHEELRSGRGVAEEYVNTSPGKEGKPEGIPSELADIVIRVFDLSGEAGIDLATVIKNKMDYNASRERLHGRKF